VGGGFRDLVGGGAHNWRLLNATKRLRLFFLVRRDFNLIRVFECEINICLQIALTYTLVVISLLLLNTLLHFVFNI